MKFLLFSPMRHKPSGISFIRMQNTLADVALSEIRETGVCQKSHFDFSSSKSLKDWRP